MSRHEKAVRFVCLLAKRLMEEGKEPRASADKKTILKAAVCSLPHGKLKKQLQKHLPIYCRKFQRCLREAREQSGEHGKYSRATPASHLTHNLYTTGGSRQEILSGMQLSATRQKQQQAASNLVAVTYNSSKYTEITEFYGWWENAVSKNVKGSDVVELCRRESTFLFHGGDVGSLCRLMNHSLQRLSRDADRILQSGDAKRASELGKHIFSLLLYFHFKSDLMQSRVESIKEGGVYRSHMTALLSIYISLNALVARKGEDVKRTSRHLLSRISLLVDGDSALMDVVLQLRSPTQGDPAFLLPVLRHVIQTQISSWTPTSYLKYMCICRIARSILHSSHAEELAALVQVMLGVSPPEDIGTWLTHHCPDVMQRIPQEAVPGQLTNFLLQVASHDLLDRLQELVTSQPSTMWDTGTGSDESSECEQDVGDEEAMIVIDSDEEDSEDILHQEQLNKRASPPSDASRSSPDDVLCIEEVPHAQTVENGPDDVEVVEDGPTDGRGQPQVGADTQLETEGGSPVLVSDDEDITGSIPPNTIPNSPNVSPCLIPDDADQVLTMREEESDGRESEDAEDQNGNDAEGIVPADDHVAMVDDVVMEMTFDKREVDVVQRRSPRLANKRVNQELMLQENKPGDISSRSMNHGKNDIQKGIAESFYSGTPDLRRSPRKRVTGAVSEGQGRETPSKERESVIHPRRPSSGRGVITRSRMASSSDDGPLNASQETNYMANRNMSRGLARTTCAETDEDVLECGHSADNASIHKMGHPNGTWMPSGGSPQRESSITKEDGGRPLEKSGAVQASYDHSMDMIIPDSENEQSDTHSSGMILRRLRDLECLKSLTSSSFSSFSSPAPKNTALANFLNNSPSMSTRSRCQDMQSCIYDSNSELSPGKKRCRTPVLLDNTTPAASPEICIRNTFTKDYTAMQVQAARSSPRYSHLRRKIPEADTQTTRPNSNVCANSEIGREDDKSPLHSPMKLSIPDHLPSKATSPHTRESCLRRSPRRYGVFKESHCEYAATPPLGTNMQMRTRPDAGSSLKYRTKVQRMLDFNGDCIGSSDVSDAESLPQIVRLSARKRKRLSR